MPLPFDLALLTPRCHPDSAALRRSDLRTATANRWRRNITFNALGWRMAERVQGANLLAGDTLDIVFTIGHNDHPEYGGLELSLADFKTKPTTEDTEEKLTPTSSQTT